MKLTADRGGVVATHPMSQGIWQAVRALMPKLRGGGSR